MATWTAAGANACSHLDSATDVEPTTPDGCEECLRDGTKWVALRMCMTCGHVGCCDSSEGTHATAHYEATQHPLMRSVMPGDSWGWCYPDSVTLQPA